jgi:hypothetical protein
MKYWMLFFYSRVRISYSAVKGSDDDAYLRLPGSWTYALLAFYKRKRFRNWTFPVFRWTGRETLTCVLQKESITVAGQTVIGLVYCLLTGCAVIENSFFCWTWLSRCSLILLHEDGNRFCASNPVACWHTLSSDWEELFLFDLFVLIHPHSFTWGWQNIQLQKHVLFLSMSILSNINVLHFMHIINARE